MAAPVDLTAIADLYREGRYLDALARVPDDHPLQDWRGPEHRLMASRLAMNLGASRRGHAMLLVAWRESPGHPALAPYVARTVLDRRGPYDAWRFAGEVGHLAFESKSNEADWYTVRARICASGRDFERAEEWVDRALHVDADHPWVHVEKAHLRLQEDRREEAEQTLHEALGCRAWYRPAVQYLAEILLQRGRRDEALDLLRRASERIQSGYVAMRLARLLVDESELALARSMAELGRERLPLAEKGLAQSIAGLRAEIAYAEGALDEAAVLARDAGKGFYANLARRLEEPKEDARRLVLDVPYVAQHHNTCGPATLAMIGPYWSKPIDHLEVAQAICYDGTPDHVERNWAESNGWTVREFSVTWEAAAALIERDIPFALTTVEATSSHLQAVVGFDERIGTLLIRDPSRASLTSAVAEPLLEHSASTGPRGMVMVPREKAELLEGVSLPDRDLFDEVFRMKRLLESHDRPSALESLERIEARHPDHPLAVRARWTLCLYDSDRVGALACIERLLERFPEDEGLQLRRATALSEVGRESDRLDLLRERVASPHSDPIFLQQLADDYRLHAPGWRRAERLLRAAIRLRPTEAIHYKTLADLRISQQRDEEALELLRHAACLDDTYERYSEAYFFHARILGRTDAALRLLRLRWERLGSQSGGPAKTLFRALSQLRRDHEGIELLEAALRERSDDADLMLFTAWELASRGENERAEALLAAAEGRSKRADWLRTAAELKERRGELHEALADWREVCELEPLSVDAHRRVASLLRRAEGMPQALAHLAEVGRRAPEHRGLLVMRIEWLRGEDETAAEALVRELIERSPEDAWAHRELALCLLDQGRAAEGIGAAEEGLRLDPRASSSHLIAAFLHEANGDRLAAAEAYRECIRIDVDRDGAIRGLVGLCEDVDERRDALRFVESELELQVVFGDGLSAYREMAAASLPPEEVLGLLREAHGARPDMWTAWAQVVKQLAAMGRLDEAEDEGRRAVERFPLVAELWVELAEVHAAQGRPEERIDALARACDISQGWSWAVRELAIALQQQGELPRAREVLEAAVRRAPRDAHNRGCLADVLHAEGDDERAVAELETALRLAPDYGWAWDVHAEWTTDAERTLALAREIAEEQSGEPHAWLALADALPEDSVDEQIAAIDRALATNRKLVGAWDRKARILAEAGRSDEALQATEEGAGCAARPYSLRARGAWVLWERGERTEAVERMREVLRAAPSLYWGWKELEDWCETLGDGAGAVEAAEAMVRIAPTDGEAWNYLGAAHRCAENTEAARSALERAFALIPHNGWTGMTLFDLQLEDGDLDAARATCESLESTNGGEFVDARRIQLETKAGDLDAALARFDQLCAEPSENTWPLESSATALEDALPFERIDEVLVRHVGADEPVRRIVDYWIRANVSRERFECEKRIEEMLSTPSGTDAMHTYVEALGERADAASRKRLDGLLRRHESALRDSTLLWGTMGYALVLAEDYEGVVSWLSDWEERDDLEAWMLQNLALSLWEEERSDEALAVSRGAVARFEPPDTAPHRMWLAAGAVLDGDGEAADRLLAEIPADEFAEGNSFGQIRDMVDAIRTVEKAGASERRAACREARRTLDRCAENARSRVYKRRLLRAGIRRVARSGGPLSWPWALWRLARA